MGPVLPHCPPPRQWGPPSCSDGRSAGPLPDAWVLFQFWGRAGGAGTPGLLVVRWEWGLGSHCQGGTRTPNTPVPPLWRGSRCIKSAPGGEWGLVGCSRSRLGAQMSGFPPGSRVGLGESGGPATPTPSVFTRAGTAVVAPCPSALYPFLAPVRASALSLAQSPSPRRATLRCCEQQKRDRGDRLPQPLGEGEWQQRGHAHPSLPAPQGLGGGQCPILSLHRQPRVGAGGAAPAVDLTLHAEHPLLQPRLRPTPTTSMLPQPGLGPPRWGM